MVNYDKPRHDWDISKKTRYKERLKQQRETGSPNVMYSSDYIETGKFLRQDKGLKKALHRESSRLLRSTESAIGGGTQAKDGVEGSFSNVLKLRHLKEGGKHGDRQAYHMYVNANPKTKNDGHRFISAQRASQFSKEAWRERQMRDEKGNYKNLPGQPNRMGWIEKGLNWTSGGRQIKGGDGA